MKKNILSLLVLIFCCTLPLRGQTISDVTFRFFDDGKVQIYYHVSLGDGQSFEDVKAYVSFDNGPFELLRTVSGDVGVIKESGKKTIVWDMCADRGLAPIDSYVKFQVVGTPKQLRGVAAWPKTNTWHFYAEYLATTDAQFGLTFGMGKKVGGYLRVRYGKVGDSERSAFTVGSYWRIAKILKLSVGLGYGMKTYTYNETEHYGWGDNDYDYETTYYPEITGMEYEATLTFNVLRWFGLTVGYSNILSGPRPPNAPQTGRVLFGLSFNF